MFPSKGAHVIVKAEGIFSRVLGREDEITLALPFALQHDFAVGTFNEVIDVERTARLDLQCIVQISTAKKKSRVALV